MTPGVESDHVASVERRLRAGTETVSSGSVFAGGDVCLTYTHRRLAEWAHPVGSRCGAFAFKVAEVAERDFDSASGGNLERVRPDVRDREVEDAVAVAGDSGALFACLAPTPQIDARSARRQELVRSPTPDRPQHHPPPEHDTRALLNNTPPTICGTPGSRATFAVVTTKSGRERPGGRGKLAEVTQRSGSWDTTSRYRWPRAVADPLLLTRSRPLRPGPLEGGPPDVVHVDVKRGLTAGPHGSFTDHCRTEVNSVCLARSGRCLDAESFPATPSLALLSWVVSVIDSSPGQMFRIGSGTETG